MAEQAFDDKVLIRDLIMIH